MGDRYLGLECRGQVVDVLVAFEPDTAMVGALNLDVADVPAAPMHRHASDIAQGQFAAFVACSKLDATSTNLQAVLPSPTEDERR